MKLERNVTRIKLYSFKPLLTRFVYFRGVAKKKSGNYSAEMDWLDWPSVTYVDIYNHLIQTPSEYTHEMLKSYKSLDG